MNRFIAVDGESFTIGNEHRYTLIADSTGRYEYDARGLSTVRCFEFLLGMPRKAIHVAYGWSYDVNMILRDLPLRELLELWHSGTTHWKSYRIEWIPSKWFVVKSGGRRVKVCEAFGFFQSSFVNALRKWDIEPTEEIETMKQERSAFDAGMKSQVISYCLAECRQLVTLMDEMEIALEAVGLKLSSWVGAGSIASALMSREGIKYFLVHDQEFGKDIFNAIRCAYFGGRSELFLQGSFTKLWDYDISSAYPSEARSLPALPNGTWKHRRKFCHHPYSLWRCEWSLESTTIASPFPVRASENRGDIFYPYRGAGWYHYPEVSTALALGYDVKVREGYTFHPATDKKPFKFIPEVYEHRRELKAEGHAGEKVLKLGLNSLYGKTAQGFGWKGRHPPFQSYYWAGLITSGCRARILELAAENLNDLVMVATDGIFFASDPGIPTSEGLGGLELTVFDDAFVAQPGVYSASVDGETVGRSRGFFSREINFDDLRTGYEETGPSYVGRYEATRFVGLGASLVTNSLDKWRTWQTVERKLSLYPSRKFIADIEPTNPVRHLSPAMPVGEFSKPYMPKPTSTPITGDELDALVSYVQGTEQPLKDY